MLNEKIKRKENREKKLEVENHKDCEGERWNDERKGRNLTQVTVPFLTNWQRIGLSANTRPLTITP